MILEKKKPIDWIFFQSVILLIGLGIDVVNKTVLFCPVFGFFTFVYYLFLNWKGFTLKKNYGGIPNLVTITRLILVFVAAFFTENNFALGFLATTIIIFDGLDGFLARKLDLVTPFGGELDMETDAFFCLMFSLLIFKNHPELSIILLGGSLRYLYKIVTTLITKETFVESRKKYAGYFAGSYFFSFMLFFYTDYSIRKSFIGVGTLLVILSFTISFYEFFRYKK